MEKLMGYKVTELGVIPEDWEIKELGDLNPFITSGSRGWADFYSIHSGYPFIRITNLSREFIYPNLEDLKLVDLPENLNEGLRTQLQPNDLLISITADIGIIGYISEDFPSPSYINQHIALVRFKNFKVEAKFISYYLASEPVQKLFQAATDTGAKAGMSLITVQKIKTVLPPLPEQKAIAAALSDVDALITAQEALITKKRDIKTATMQQLLTGKVRLGAFGQRAGASGGQPEAGVPPGYQQTELGVIPEDWNIVKIGDLVTEFKGGAPLKPSDFTRDGVKVLPKGGVLKGGVLKIQEKDQQFCSLFYAKKYSSNTVDETYTIVVLRDLVPSGPSIGLMVNIHENDCFYVLAQGVYGFKTNDKAISEYLIQYSNSTPYRKLMNEIMVGSTQVHITNTAFKEAQMPLPTLPEQQAIAEVLSDMDAEISALEAQLAKTRSLKQGMMQELLTGKTRLVGSA